MSNPNPVRTILRVIHLMALPSVILSSRVSPASMWRIWRNRGLSFQCNISKKSHSPQCENQLRQCWNWGHQGQRQHTRPRNFQEARCHSWISRVVGSDSQRPPHYHRQRRRQYSSQGWSKWRHQSRGWALHSLLPDDLGCWSSQGRTQMSQFGEMWG